MEIKREVKDSKIKKLSELSDKIEITDVYRGKWAYYVKCKCLVCNHEWDINERSFKKLPTCPKCRDVFYPKDNTTYTTEEWIAKLKRIHPEFICDGRTVYKNNKTSITVKCSKHDYFTASPKNIIKPEYECAKCKRERLLKEEGLKIYEQLNELYGNKGFKFDMTNYRGVKYEIECECPEHGPFKQTPYSLLKGRLCQKCSFKKRGDKKRLNTEDFIEKAKTLRKDRNDDFSKAVYVNSRTQLTLICNKIDKYGRIHGEYDVAPFAYLRGQSCPKCSGKHQMDLKEFKEVANIVHNGKYDYDKVTDYKGTHFKIPIICHEVDELGREHGIFEQTVKHHLEGFGCKKCSHTYMDLDLFKYRGNKIHGGKYIYDLITTYKNNTTKVWIVCPEHGPFEQTPMCHLQGQGCPYCRESHLERSVDLSFKEADIDRVRGKRFKWLINDKTGYPLPLDFYFEDKKLAIECQGEQHFLSNFYKSKGDEYAEEHLSGVQYRDNLKKMLCFQNNVHLIYFLEEKFVKFLQPTDIYFTSLEKLVEYVKNYQPGILLND